MIEDTITIYRCDRCGHKHSVNKSDQYGYQSMWTWGTLWYSQQNGPIYMSGHPNLPKSVAVMPDLCPDCMIELNEWYNKPKTGNF